MRADSVAATVRVKTLGGRQIIETTPPRVAIDSGGGATQGILDLAGLPPGDYRLDLTLTTRDSQVARGAPFGMAGFETARRVAEAARAGEGSVRAPAASDTFGSLGEAALDSLYLPLMYLMKPEEQNVYPGLTVDGKRSYLRRFWASRNTTPGAGQNEAMERFYQYVKDANNRFREGSVSAIPGWRTDRGRIFMKYGPPDETLSRPQSGPTRPYEVWKYARGRARRFIFMDLSQFGNYALIWTDEPREPSRPNWKELLGDEAAADAFRF